MTQPQAPLGVYVHWPFCKSKCPYCDFNSHVRDGVEQARWRKALLTAGCVIESRRAAAHALIGLAGASPQSASELLREDRALQLAAEDADVAGRQSQPRGRVGALEGDASVEIQAWLAWLAWMVAHRR